MLHFIGYYHDNVNVTINEIIALIVHILYEKRGKIYSLSTRVP